MLPKSALELLFEHDFGNGPLFKNQIELVNELISNIRSSYYQDNDDSIKYTRAVSRLKAYISQLLSDSARRSVTTELHESLRTVIKDRLIASEVNADDITEMIISDFKSINRKDDSIDSGVRKSHVVSGFLKEVIGANYLSVFTSREILFQYEMGDKKVSFVDLLIRNLIDSIKSGVELKYYRFNFPLEQTCELFWRGLRKEVIKYLKTDASLISSLLSTVKLLPKNSFENQVQEDVQDYGNAENRIVSGLLNYLSSNGIINVFHLEGPAYLVPSVAINPNESNNACTYLFLQSSQGGENLHKLSSEEQVLWKLFFWNNLKKNKIGKSIEYRNAF